MALTQEEFDSLPDDIKPLIDLDLMDLPDDYYEPVKIGPTWQTDEDGDWILPEHTLGWEIAGWAAKWLRHEDGPWTFTLEQLRFLLWLYAVDENGKFVYRKAVLQRLKGWGKDPFSAVICLVEFVGPCRFSHWGPDGEPVGKPVSNSMVQIAAVNQEQPLSLDTLIPTPDGPVRLKDVRIGDLVFDEHGNAVSVARETETFYDKDCYRITFDDGTAITASANHGWTVDRKNSHGDRYEQVTISTQEMAETCRDSMGRNRIRIPLAPRLTEDRDDLLIDPYMLGMWLGDGSRDNGCFAVGRADLDETLANLQAVLQPHERIVVSEGSGCMVLNVRGTSRHADQPPALIQRLRAEGLLGNKHVPAKYLYAGTDQRLALLQGLMDSDGCATKQGNVVFTNTNRLLVDAVLELARSLGHKPTVTAHGPNAWVVKWTPAEDAAPLFRLARKQERVGVTKVRKFRYLRSVEKVDSVPVKCIGIDTETHLFQVESGVLTHNTSNTASMFASLMSDEFIAEYDIKPGVELTYAKRGTCRLKTVTSSPRALEGNRVTFAILNEVQHWLLGNKGHDMYEVIYQNAAKMNGRWLAITNAYKPGEESIGERLRTEYEDGQQGRLLTTQRFLYDSLEAQAKLPIHPLFLRRAAEAVRGDSIWLNLDTIVESIMDTSIPVSRSIRMWLNRIVATEDQLFEEADYERVRLDTGRIHPGETVVLGFDGGKTDDSTAIVAIRIEDHVAQLVRIWEKPEGLEGKGWAIDTEAVDAAVREAMEMYNVIGFYADVHPWESYVDAWNRDFGEELLVKSSAKNAVAWDMRGSLKRSTAANEALVDAFREKSIRIVHSANMRTHILNVYRRENNFGVSFGKESRGSSRKVDAYAALMLAHECMRDYFAGKKPEEERSTRGWFL